MAGNEPQVSIKLKIYARWQIQRLPDYGIY